MLWEGQQHKSEVEAKPQPLKCGQVPSLPERATASRKKPLVLRLGGLPDVGCASQQNSSSSTGKAGWMCHANTVLVLHHLAKEVSLPWTSLTYLATTCYHHCFPGHKGRPGQTLFAFGSSVVKIHHWPKQAGPSYVTKTWISTVPLKGGTQVGDKMVLLKNYEILGCIWNPRLGTGPRDNRFSRNSR